MQSRVWAQSTRQGTGYRENDMEKREQGIGKVTRHWTHGRGHIAQDKGHRTKDTGHRARHRAQGTGHRTQGGGHRAECRAQGKA